MVVANRDVKCAEGQTYLEHFVKSTVNPPPSTLNSKPYTLNCISYEPEPLNPHLKYYIST